MFSNTTYDTYKSNQVLYKLMSATMEILRQYVWYVITVFAKSLIWQRYGSFAYEFKIMTNINMELLNFLSFQCYNLAQKPITEDVYHGEKEVI